MRRELQAQVEQQALLQAELNALQQQLAEANQGLRAASRLSDQLEAGQQAIAVLRDEGESMHSNPACSRLLTNPHTHTHTTPTTTVGKSFRVSKTHQFSIKSTLKAIIQYCPAMPSNIGMFLTHDPHRPHYIYIYYITCYISIYRTHAYTRTKFYLNVFFPNE